MGKTAEGAVWLDPNKTSPYEYYQYWINTDDRDVVRFMALFTFLPMEEIKSLEKLSGADLNSAKVILAFEVTQTAHGMEEAFKAYRAAESVFGSRVVPEEIMPSSSLHEIHAGEWFGTKTVAVGIDAIIEPPHSEMDMDQFNEGVPAFKLYQMVGLASSGSAARRLIEQGGAYVNGKRLESFDYLLTDNDIIDLEILLRAGKKRYHKIKIIKNKP
jgi:tyrosyl-tRNA synthetase